MEYAKENLVAIEKGFPELYERIKNRSIEIHNVFAIETGTARKALVLQDENGENWRLNSMYDPDFEAKIWFQAQESLDAKNLFLMGLGNGSFARELVRIKKAEAKVVIYEPSAELFLCALQNVDLKIFFATPGVRVIVRGLNDDMYSGVMEEMLTVENCEDKAFFVAPKYGDLFPEARKELVAGYLDGVGRIMSNKNTIARFLHISPKNYLYNVRFLQENTAVPCLNKIWEKDVPVVIIGAGPSLHEEIDTIRKYRNQAFWFAVDSSLPFLLQQDIIPDAYICIEADKPMSFFEDERVNTIPLFARLNTTYHLQKRHTGRKVFGFEDGFGERIYEEYGIPQSQYRYGGNGATSFFAIAKEIGVKRVILLGQDMAFDKSGKSHVGGRDEGYVEEERLKYLNNLGEPVQSRQDWHRFIKWYENAIPVCQFEDVINCSAHGVHIKGTRYLPLRDALEQYGKEHASVEALLAKAEPATKKSIDLEKLYQKIENEIKTYEQGTQFKSKIRQDAMCSGLLEQYEIAGQGNLIERRKNGVRKIAELIQECREER